MNLKSLFIAILISCALTSCNFNENKNKNDFYLDSLRKADSTSVVLEQQRLIDSINLVTREQQIIADSIHSLIVNGNI